MRIPTNRNERWARIILKDSKGMENPTKYWISTQGRVWSEYSNKILSPGLMGPNNGQYYGVILFVNSERYTCKVHRLVAEAFIPNPNNDLIVNHKDEDKLNNRIENLEWCNMQYNLTYGTARTRQGKTLSDRTSQLYIMCSPYTGEVIDFGTLKYCSEKYNIPKNTIENCMTNLAKSAKGYSWVRKSRDFKIAKGDILQEGITKTPPAYKNKKTKVVELIDIHSKENPIHIFSTLTECAEYLHVAPATISYACINNSLVAKRYRIMKKYR